MAAKETPLTGVPGLSEDVVRKLKGRWITSADQLVALAASPQSLKSLATELGIDEGETKRMVHAARSVLDPATSAALDRPVDTRKYPLGVRNPKDSA
jgi:hypothetical protein